MPPAKNPRKETLYEVTVEGEYFAFSETGAKKAQRPYTLTFKANNQMKKQGFLSVFRNALRPKDGGSTALLRLMKAKYPDYKSFRTHHLTNVVDLTNKAPIAELALMNRSQIVRYIDHKGLPVDSDLYPSVSDLRQALRDYKESPEAFAKQQEKRRATKGVELSIYSALDRLNDVPAPQADADAPLPMDHGVPPAITEYDEAEEMARFIDGSDDDDTLEPDQPEI